MYYKINARLAAVNFEILAASVNATEGRKVLRKQHREYLMELVRMANMQAYANNRDAGIVNQGEAVLNTNGSELADTLGCCPRTIRNYNALLEHYGIVERVFHGTCRNYDLKLNKYICTVANSDDVRDYPLLSEALSGGLRDRANAAILRLFFATAKRQNFPHRYKYLNILNNQSREKGVSDGQTPAALLTTPVQDVENGSSEQCTAVGVATLAEYVNLLVRAGVICEPDSRDLCRDTGAEPTNDEPNQSQSRETAGAGAPVCAEAEAIDQSEAAMRDKNLDEYKDICARMLLSYAIDRIPGWKGRIYPGVADEVTLSIREQYFDDLRNKWQCTYILGVAYTTIQVASRYIRKKLTTGRWTEFRMMPPTYFDKDTKNGFMSFFSSELSRENARLRRKSLTEKVEALKYYERERRLNNLKLNKILKAYFDHPTPEVYRRCLALVKQTIPQRLTQFQNCVADARRRQAAFWKKQENVAVSPRIAK